MSSERAVRSSSHARTLHTSSSEKQIKSLIAGMLIVGFDDESVTPQSKIYRQLKEHPLGGVILFDRFYHKRDRVKNIRNPQQLKRLTTQLQQIASRPLIIAVDQEGGRVARLNPEYGFLETPSAASIGAGSDVMQAKASYDDLAGMLNEHGINCNFAPVVDLRINEANKVIVKLERSYGKDPEYVVKFAGTFRDALKRQGIISVLKHFPGHGSSQDDSHEGFVDVSESWSETELQAYKIMIDNRQADMIMTAHVFNRRLDPQYPATLSYAVNTGLLRKKLGFEGVVVSDDLQMKAISEHYPLEETVTLAINTGVDMLLFGNQLAYQDLDELIEVIYKQVQSDAIKLSTIEAANTRIDALRQHYFHNGKKA